MEICSLCECFILGEALYCNECDALHCGHCFTPDSAYPYDTDEMTVTFEKEPVVR